MRGKFVLLARRLFPALRFGGNTAKITLRGVVLMLGIGVLLSVRSVMPPSPDMPEKSVSTSDALQSERALASKDVWRSELTRKLQEQARKKSQENELGKTAASPPKKDEFTKTTGMFARADTVIGVLLEHGVGRSEIQEILDSVRNKRVFSRIRTGRRYEVKKKDGAFREFMFQIDKVERLKISRTPDGKLTARREPIPYHVEVVRIESQIQDSLHQAITDGGGAPVLVNKLGDIFAYVIDFHKDLQKGDQVEVLVERKRLRGEFAGYGKILAARFIVGGRRHTAAYFEHAGGGYFNFEGESLRRAFLRSPLRYTRISSRFSKRRFHPLLKRYRPHLGVDYAAPRGTPVHAVADGVVTWVGRKGQGGRTIKLRHGGGYRTSYLHLYRYARGMRKGRRVSQGEVIGYVGSSGLSTGPHLDYRITRRGRYLNPLKANLPKGMPLPLSLRSAFKKILEERRTMFDNLPLLKEVQISPAAHELTPGGAEKRTTPL